MWKWKWLTAKKLKEELILASEDGHANGASDLFVLEQVNARGMGITTTIYKRNAAMCSI